MDLELLIIIHCIVKWLGVDWYEKVQDFLADAYRRCPSLPLFLFLFLSPQITNIEVCQKSNISALKTVWNLLKLLTFITIFINIYKEIIKKSLNKVLNFG
jgi:hypothetical protein